MAEHPEDDLLIAQCMAGSHEAWALLIERYERLIYSIPLRYGLSESQAADVFQDVCLILLNKLEQVRDEKRLAAWLGTVTRRECWKAMQRRDAAGQDDPDPVLTKRPSTTSDPDAMVEEWEAWVAVRAALACLDERCRHLLQRLYYSAPTPRYVEIAEELDIPVGSVGPTRARCLKKLQREMGGDYYQVYHK